MAGPADASRAPYSPACPLTYLLTCLPTYLLTYPHQFGAGIWWAAGLEVTGIGSVAASVAYFTAMLIDKVVGA